MDLYPYGGTRHSVFLLVFASAAIGVAVSAMSAGRLWPAVVLVAVALWSAVAGWLVPDLIRAGLDGTPLDEHLNPSFVAIDRVLPGGPKR